MVVLTGVNLDNKDNMYEEAKHSLIKFGDLMEEQPGTGPDVRLEPAWKKTSINSYRKGSVQNCSNEMMKKKRNPLGFDRLIWLCRSCGSYTHIMAECPDSWEIR